jgi:hypothetical protein
MRRRIVLFVALAVVTALVGFYAGRARNAPTPTAEALVSPPSSSVGFTQWPGTTLCPVALAHRLLAEGRLADGKCETGRQPHPVGPQARDASNLASAAP